MINEKTSNGSEDTATSEKTDQKKADKGETGQIDSTTKPEKSDKKDKKKKKNKKKNKGIAAFMEDENEANAYKDENVDESETKKSSLLIEEIEVDVKE